MRIGTWNMAARTSGQAEAFLRDLNCEVLLLTEVPPALRLPDHRMSLSEGVMTPGQAFAAVALRISREPLSIASEERAPHPAAARAEGGRTTFLASVLPWRSAQELDGFPGDSQGERTRGAVEALAAGWPDGRVVLQAPTGCLGAHGGYGSVNHIAVPTSWTVMSVSRHEAVRGRGRLSDHDAYVVETTA